jgi:hypothetical protein
VPLSFAVTAATTKSRTLRPWRRQLSTFVKIHSTKRLPDLLWLPKLTRRQRTGGRIPCSEELLAGHTGFERLPPWPPV